MKWCLACAWALSVCRAGAADMHFADSLYAAGNFQRAAMEYERVFFNDTASSVKATALLRRAYCYKAQQDFAGAYHTLLRITHLRLGDSLDYRIRHEKALCAYLAYDYSNAEYELQQMDFFIHDTLLTAQSLYLQVLVLSELEKWDETKQAMKKYFAMQHISTDTLNFEAWMPPAGLRSAKKAKLLSCLFPGLGQLYAGYPGRAASALLLQGAAAAFAVYSFMHGYYLEGLFTGTGLFLRFYTGGIRYAEKLVIKRNTNKSNGVKQRIKNAIVEYETTKK